MTIYNRSGERIQVTNLRQAKIQAKQAIDFLSTKVGIQYPESLKDWKHIESELNKLDIPKTN